MGDYRSYGSFYTGGYSSLSPEYGNFIGYRINASSVGSPTSIQTANQLSEVLARIREGVKNVELQPIQADTFDQIPKEQFKEIAAISKLTGVKPSLHAPMVDPAGFGERGWEGDQAREDAERRLFNVLERSQQLDPNGNVPVVIHSTAGVPGNEFRPGKDKDGNEIKPGKEGRFYEQKIAVIDQESKQISGVQEEKRFYADSRMKEGDWKEGHLTTARDFLRSTNYSQWEQKMSGLAASQKEAGEALNYMMTQSRNANATAPDIFELQKEEVRVNPDGHLNMADINNLAQKNPQVWHQMQNVDLFMQNNELTLNSLFHNAYKYAANDNQKEKLRELQEKWQKEEEKLSSNPYQRQIESFELFNKKVSELKYETQGPANAPRVIKPVEEFAMEKSAETFGNVAFKAYEKFQDKMPIMAIENMFQGMAFSKAEDMKKLIDISRENFAKNLVEKRGMSESEAKDQASKFIGATWDVGHLNMIKKHGFTDEDVAKETEKISKYVKHIHLTDNFGYSDSHLVPGMGNVPFKKIFEELEKAGTLDKARKIVEAGAFVQHFKKSPHSYVLAALGAPIYGGGPGWNRAAETFGGYFSYPMAYLPEKHFSMYGTGFSMLPEELGGQIPGTQSRFSGTPNA